MASFAGVNEVDYPLSGLDMLLGGDDDSLDELIDIYGEMLAEDEGG